MTSRSSILCLGSVNSDAFLRLASIPRPGETVTGGHLSYALGGKGANAAVAARRSSREGASVLFSFAVGDDAAGHAAWQTLQEEGLSLDHAFFAPEVATGAAFIFLDAGGQNAIAVAPGANFSWNVERVESLREAIAGAALLVVGNEITPSATRRALELAQESKTPVLLNYAPVGESELPLSDAISFL